MAMTAEQRHAVVVGVLTGLAASATEYRPDDAVHLAMRTAERLAACYAALEVPPPPQEAP